MLLPGKQAVHQGEFHPRSCPATVRQCLIIGVGKPVPANLLRGKTRGYDATGARQVPCMMQRLFFPGTKLAAGFFQQREKVLFKFLAVYSVGDDWIGEHIQGDIDHNDALFKIVLSESLQPTHTKRKVL
jgi:hypothetical protein